MSNISRFLSRLDKKKEQELMFLIEELGLVPSNLVTPELARSWRDKVLLDSIGDLRKQEEIEDSISLMLRFNEQSKHRKPIIPDYTSVQLKINFD